MLSKNRKRKIIWFNPHFCRLASINVGKYFLKLIDKHFKHSNILHKIFHRKTFKISYSCTKNIFQIINNHNKEIIKGFHDRTNNNNNNNNNNKSKQNECNCKTQINCPMNGLCNLDNVVYQGIIYPKENVKDKKKIEVDTCWQINKPSNICSFHFTFSTYHSVRFNSFLLALYYWYIELFTRKILNIHSWIISCPDGITPNSGLTGLSILYIYIYISHSNSTPRVRCYTTSFSRGVQLDLKPEFSYEG